MLVGLGEEGDIVISVDFDVMIDRRDSPLSSWIEQ